MILPIEKTSRILFAIVLNCVLMSSSLAQGEESIIYLNGLDTISLHPGMSPSVFRFSDVDMTVSIGTAESLQTFAGIQPQEVAVGLVDINLDGYLDIRIEKSAHNLDPSLEFWLFSPKKSLFEYNEDFSSLRDYSVNIKKRQIISNSHATGGRGGETWWYNIAENNLQPTRHVSENRLDCEVEEQVDGSWQVIERHVEETVNDSISTLSKYKRIADSLCLVEKFWLLHPRRRPTKQQLANGVGQCEAWGCYIFIKKEECEYNLTPSGPHLRKVLRSKVVNDHWEGD